MTLLTSPHRKWLWGQVCVVLFLCQGAIWGAQPHHPIYGDPILEPWRWKAFPELNGLGLRCLAQARDSTLWFGTDAGVRSYDGRTWSAYTPEDGFSGTPVNAIFGARDGSVYVGTETGISRFYGDKWHRVFPPEGDLPWPVNDFIETKRGDLWAGTAWGALHLKREGPILVTSEEMAKALRPLAPYVELFPVPNHAVPEYPWRNEGSLGDIGIRVAEGGSIGLPRGTNPVVIWEVAPGSTGEQAGLMLGDRLLAVLDGQPISFNDALFGPTGSQVKLTVQRGAQRLDVRPTRKPMQGVYKAFSVFDICQDREGAFWFGLETGELVHWKNPGSAPGNLGDWQLYSENQLSKIGRLPQITQTRDGAIWAISYVSFSGVNKFHEGRWTYRDLKDLGGSSSNTAIVETQDGTLWIGGFGLQIYRNGSWHMYRSQNVPIPSQRNRLIKAFNGSIWLIGLGQEAVQLDYSPTQWLTYEGLNFQFSTERGTRWFISRDSSVVRQKGSTWTRYTAEDGLMEMPVTLIETGEGNLWAAGSHDSTAATAIFDGKQWHLTKHPSLSWGTRPYLFQSRDGHIWVGAGGNFNRRRGHASGVIRYDSSTWTHYKPPDAPEFVRSITQTSDGHIWTGAREIRRFDGQNWKGITDPEKLRNTWCEVVYTTHKGDLWIGTRIYGAFHYDGETWTQYDVRDGLAENRIQSLLEGDNGSMWAASSKGISRFDGRRWTTYVFPQNLPRNQRPSLLKSRDGAIWINYSVGDDFRTIRYKPDSRPPETEITSGSRTISHSDHPAIFWSGMDPWQSTSDAELQYAWRLDGGQWSAFSKETHETLVSLSSGDHTFAVKARDLDFNEDPTPALMHFTVVPPVWQQPWFLGLLVVLLGGIGLQTGRVIHSHRLLRESNAALSVANRDLFGLNQGLQRDRAVERVRAEVTAMTSAEDLLGVVVAMLKELSEAEVDFDLCVTNIVDEEAEILKQYGATKQGGSGQAEMSLSQVSEDFMAIYRGDKPVVRQVDDRLAAACIRIREQLGITDWMACPTAVVDAPFAYGTLSFHTQNLEGFSEDDVAFVGEFARVMALGYARFLDFRNLEEQNKVLQRESAVERIRTQVQTMEQAEDFDGVLAVLAEDLKTVGLDFGSCGIDVLNEPVDDPTMAYFEERGFRSTTYKIDPQGRVTRESYHISAPFPDVIRGTIERFVAGQVWQGRDMDMGAMVEVPISQYGRLRMTALGRQAFTAEETSTLQDFAVAIALGYARYLDFQQLEAQNTQIQEQNTQIQEQTERKSRFLANMTHELRSPMNAILGFARIVLRREKNISDLNRENLQNILESSDHLLNLINDILDLSKIEAGQMDVVVKKFDVKGLINFCRASVDPLVKPGVVLLDDVSDGVGEAHTDGRRLRQIVINLLSNALKFTDQGEVVVRASNGQIDGKASLVMAVSDTGTGIPADALDTILEEFQQVKGSDPQHKGTGLGLPITKSLAELLGGSISVQSEIGKGSTFTVQVPVVYEE